MARLEWDQPPGRPRPPEEAEAEEYLRNYAGWVAQQQDMVRELDEANWAANERRAMAEHDATGLVGRSPQTSKKKRRKRAIKRLRWALKEALYDLK